MLILDLNACFGTAFREHFDGNRQFGSIYPELYHYTGPYGLKGIVESNCLWATRYSHLNDSTEITAMREPLLTAAQPRIDMLLRKGRYVNPRINAMVSRYGGVKGAARAIITETVDVLYSMCFHDDESIGRASLATPYIASFCSHSDDQEYERQNGLLSQWRGYGREGYCIVFDTTELANLLKKEFGEANWTHLNIDATTYRDESFSSDEFFAHLVTELERVHIIKRTIPSGEIERTITHGEFICFLLTRFIECACLLKHQGFKEEREVRIVAAPGTRALHDMIMKDYGPPPSIPLKRIYERSVGDKKVSYLKLFETLNADLPIKRVIVGPSERQQENHKYAMTIIAKRPGIQVVLSQTPYIGS